MLVTLAGILAYLVTSSSSVGSSVSGEVENTRQEASNILKSQFGTFRTFIRDDVWTRWNVVYTGKVLNFNPGNKSVIIHQRLCF